MKRIIVITTEMRGRLRQVPCCHMIRNFFLASMNRPTCIHKLGHEPFRYSGRESLRSQPPTSEDQLGGLSISTWDAQDMFLEERRTMERRAQRGALFGGMMSSGATMLELNVSQLIHLSSSLQLREEGRLRKRKVMIISPEDECTTPITKKPDRELRLTRANSHVRDCRIKFFEEDHVYILDGVQKFPQSVSAVWSAFFDKFKPVETIDKFFNRWSSNVESKYFAFIKERRNQCVEDNQIKKEIAEGWSKKGKDASEKGTFMHLQIELFLNGCLANTCSVEMDQFKEFLRFFVDVRKWVPFRTEWSIYDEKHMIAGQIDAIFKDLDGHLHIVDWKRVREDMDPFAGAHFRRYGKTPCDDLLDNKFNHYAAQQNLYALILKDNYDIHVKSLSLVQLHEDRVTYAVHEVPFFTEVARAMIAQCAHDRSPSTMLLSDDFTPTQMWGTGGQADKMHVVSPGPVYGLSSHSAVSQTQPATAAVQSNMTHEMISPTLPIAGTFTHILMVQSPCGLKSPPRDDETTERAGKPEESPVSV